MKNSQVQKIKASISCADYARRAQLVPNEVPNVPNARCRSFREGATNDTSLLLAEHSWFDFGFPGPNGQGLGGDVIDLCAWARHGGRIGPAIRELAAMAGLTDDPAYHPPSDAIDLTDAARAFHKALQPSDREYLHRRGITDETIDRLLIGRASDHGIVLGLSGRLAIPFWQSHRVRYFVGRSMDGSEPKYKCMPHSPGGGWIEHPIWGIDSLNRDGRVILCEGLLDAVSVWQCGLPVLASGGVRFSRSQMEMLLSLLYGREATVAFDYDPKSGAGQAGADALARTLFAAGIQTRVLLLNGGESKVDLNDLHARGNNLQEILGAAVDYWRSSMDSIAALTDPAMRKENLKQFLQTATETWPWHDVAEMIGYAKSLDRWDKAWLGSLEKTLKSPPTDNEIVNRLDRQYHLVFDPRTGWFLYDEDRGVWVERPEVAVEGLCARILGRHVSGPRLVSASRSARAKFHRAEEMNPRRDIVNLANGMLRLSDRALLAHDPDYYSTIQVDYSWDPNAVCPEWDKFLEAVFNDGTPGWQRRATLLQEIFGYCLLTKCRYEKAFVFLGEGSNGKSVTIDVLTQVLGEANVSCVPLAQLGESFQRIRLYGRLANLCTETHSEVHGVEEILKQIVSGDKISGARKYRDELEFRPFCTCIFATNQLAETQDTSYGFQRKLLFLQFPVKFEDAPNTEEGEKIKDNAIREKLFPELPGIFRWALDGLDRLTRNNGFTRTDDHKKAMDEYLTISNPIIAWLDDEPPQVNLWLERRELYRRYKTWCNEYNTKPLSGRKFWPRLRAVAKVDERKSGDRMIRILSLPGKPASAPSTDVDQDDRLPF